MTKIHCKECILGRKLHDETETFDVTFYDRENKQVGQLTLDGTCLYGQTRTKLTAMLDPKGKGNVR